MIGLPLVFNRHTWDLGYFQDIRWAIWQASQLYVLSSYPFILIRKRFDGPDILTRYSSLVGLVEFMG